MAEKTNYAQSLMHMIKGNLGTGILAMPASFAHVGMINAIIGLPILCLIATYCVHILIKSSQQLEKKSIGANFKYASLAKCSLESGPSWMHSFSNLLCLVVDGTLLVAQIGVCCVYLVFVVDNVVSIMKSYELHVQEYLVFLAIFPIALLLSYIRTLRRLAIFSGFANLLEASGICIVLQYLLRDLDKINMADRDKFRPLNEVALGFGSAMFAFEGISVVLPVYTRMKNPDRMSGCWGVINLSFALLCLLYFTIGLFGFLKFGRDAGDSITLNLPSEPLYDAVRALFTVAVFLTYPLQFYVPNEIIWNWAKVKLFMEPELRNPEATVGQIETIDAPTIKVTDESDFDPDRTLTKLRETQGNESPKSNEQMQVSSPRASDRERNTDRYEYCCRSLIVIFTFVVAICVPKLNLLMDLIGSITGTILSLILPAIIHMAAFWNDTKGLSKVLMISVDCSVIVIGIAAGVSGSISSLSSIINSFRD